MQGCGHIRILCSPQQFSKIVLQPPVYHPIILLRFNILQGKLNADEFMIINIDVIMYQVIEQWVKHVKYKYYILPKQLCPKL